MSKIFHKIAAKLSHKDHHSSTTDPTNTVQQPTMGNQSSSSSSGSSARDERSEPQLTAKIGNLSVHDNEKTAPTAGEAVTETQQGDTAVAKTEDYSARAATEVHRDEEIERQQVEERLSKDESFREEPVIRERVHHEYTHVDKTQVERIHDRTEIRTVIQPIIEERHVGEDWRAVDDGVTVREYGAHEFDASTVDKLRARHEAAQAQGGREEFETHKHISDERPDITVRERTRVVEQVLPVIERVIYVPQRVERSKDEAGQMQGEAVVHDTSMQAPSTTVGTTTTSSSSYSSGGAMGGVVAPVVESEWTKHHTCDDEAQTPAATI